MSTRTSQPLSEIENFVDKYVMWKTAMTVCPESTPPLENLNPWSRAMKHAESMFPDDLRERVILAHTLMRHCANCGERRFNHVNDKCLWAPTTFVAADL